MLYKLLLFDTDWFILAALRAAVQTEDTASGWFEELRPFAVSNVGAEVTALLKDATTVPGNMLSPEQNRPSWEFHAKNGLLWRVEMKALLKASQEQSETLTTAWGRLLCITLNWRYASAFISSLLNFACRQGLFLVDLQKPDLLLWSPKMLGHTEPFQCQRRAGELVHLLLSGMNGLQYIVKIANWNSCLGKATETRRCSAAAYALVLSNKKRVRPQNLKQKAKELCSLLGAALLPEETLTFHDRFFWVGSKKCAYEIAFCLEAYGKNACMTVHMDSADPENYPERHGEITEVLLHRQGSLQLKRRARELSPHGLKDSPIVRRMGVSDMAYRFPDPGLRFAASVRMEKLFQYLGCGLTYDSSTQSYDSDCITLEDVDHWRLGESCEDLGTLAMKEELFYLLLPVISTCVSGGIEIYSFLNMLSPMQCTLIEKKLKDLAWYISHDPKSPELTEYLEKLPRSGFFFWEDPGFEKSPLEQPGETLVRHRKKLCAFFSFLIDWFSTRGEDVTTQDRAVNICGL